MKRKETKPSPVKTKKGRASLESAPTPLQATVEEQRRKAREWFEQEEERKKLPATSSASNASRSRSTTPTSKVPAKKAKKEEIEERTTRSTRNTARNGSPVRNRRKVIEEKVEDSTEGEESEEEMSAPVSAPRSRKAVAKATPEIESAPVVKTPSGKKSRASLGSAKTPTEPISVEDQRQKAKDWAAKEAEPTKAARTPKSATKTPSVATPKITPAAEARLRSESTASASSSRQASAIKGMTMPAASPLPAEPARCPFSTLGGPNPHLAENQQECTTSAPSSSPSPSSCCDASCKLCGVTLALTVIPLGVIGYYDPKIAVTTLVVMVILSALRRIFRMVAADDNTACSAEE